MANAEEGELALAHRALDAARAEVKEAREMLRETYDALRYEPKSPAEVVRQREALERIARFLDSKDKEG
jgi:tRNA U34 5-methylaminomethyl-2-thiouridine-forming methyltransferase MnmC